MKTRMQIRAGFVRLVMIVVVYILFTLAVVYVILYFKNKNSDFTGHPDKSDKLMAASSFEPDINF